MAEVAGLVLGGLPLAIVALDKYGPSVQALWKDDATRSTFRDELILERARLNATLNSIGVSWIDDEDATFAEVETRLKNKFPLEVRLSFLNIIQAMSKSVRTLLNMLDVGIREKPSWTDLESRAKWEWGRVKRNLRSRERKSIIEELRGYNNALERLVDKSELSSHLDDIPLRIQKRYDPTRCYHIRLHAKDMYAAIESCWCSSCKDGHSVNMELDWLHRAGDDQTAVHLGIGLPGPNKAQTPDSRKWLNVRILEEDGQSYASLDPEKPIMARKGTPSLDLEAGRGKGKSARSPMFAGTPHPDVGHGSLRRDSPGFFRLCDATIPDKEDDPYLGSISERKTICRKFSVCHRVAKPQVKTISLSSILATRNITHLRLSLKERMRLAAQLARAVLYLAESPWLDWDWNINDIAITLEHLDANDQVLSTFPCLIRSFATESGRNRITSAETSRPKSTLSEQVDFARTHNLIVFELGLILIELALGESFDGQSAGVTEMSEVPISRPARSMADYSKACEKLSDVHDSALSWYAEAVQRCIMCQFSGRHTLWKFEESAFRKAFNDDVVSLIEATYTHLP